MSLTLERVDGDTSIQDDLTRIRNENYTAIEDAVNNKAESSDVYTQTETDNLLADKQDKAITIDEEATTVESAISLALSRQDVVLDNDIAGDCDTVFSDSEVRLTTTIDTVNKIQGTGSNKLTLDSGEDNGYDNKSVLGEMSAGHEYLIISYIKNNDLSTGARIGLVSNLKAILGDYVLSTEFTLSFIKIPSSFIEGTETALFLRRYIDGNEGESANFDAIQLLNKTQLGLTDIPDDIIKYVIEEHGYFEGEMTVSQKEMFIAMCKYMAENRSQIVALGGSF